MNKKNRKKITIFNDDDFKMEEYPYNDTTNTKSNKDESKEKVIKNNNQSSNINHEEEKEIDKIIYNKDGVPIGQELDLSVLNLLNNKPTTKKYNVFDDYPLEENSEEDNVNKNKINIKKEYKEPMQDNNNKKEITELKKDTSKKRILKNNNRDISSKVITLLNELFPQKKYKNDTDKIKSFNERFFSEEKTSNIVKELNERRIPTTATGIDSVEVKVAKNKLDNVKKRSTNNSESSNEDIKTKNIDSNSRRDENIQKRISRYQNNEDDQSHKQMINGKDITPSRENISKEEKDYFEDKTEKNESMPKSRVEQNKAKYEELYDNPKSRVVQNKDNYEKILHEIIPDDNKNNSISQQNRDTSFNTKTNKSYEEQQNKNNSSINTQKIIIDNNNRNLLHKNENIVFKEPISEIKKEEKNVKKDEKIENITKKVDNQNINSNQEKQNVITKDTTAKVKKGKVTKFEVVNNKPINPKKRINVDNDRVEIKEEIIEDISEIKNEKMGNISEEPFTTKISKYQKNDELRKKRENQHNVREYEKRDTIDNLYDISLPKKSVNKDKRQLDFDFKFTNNILVTIFLLAISIFFIYNSVEIRKKDSIVYKEQTNTDYVVYLNDTRFYKEENSYNNYLSQVVKLIKINMNYKFNINEKSNLNFKYKIVGDLIVTDKEDTNKEVYKKSYVLLEENNQDIKKSERFNIKKDISIDYKYYKDIADEFSKTYNVETNSYMKIYLVVNIKDNKNNSFELISKEKSSVKIPLSEDYVNIEIDEINKEQNVENKSKIMINNVLFLICGIAIFFINIAYNIHSKIK